MCVRFRRHVCFFVHNGIIMIPRGQIPMHGRGWGMYGMGLMWQGVCMAGIMWCVADTTRYGQ